MHIDYNNPNNSTFRGKNSEANEYLRSTPFPKAGSFLDAGHNIKLTLNETINIIFWEAEKRRKLLDSYKHLTSKFKLLEKARIKADIINSLIYIDFYFPHIHKLSEDSTLLFRKDSKIIIDPYLKYYCKNFINQGFLKIVVYRDIISKILKQNDSTNNNSPAILEWISARKLLQKIKQLNKFEDNYKLAREIDNINQTQYQLPLLSAFNQVMQFNVGDSAIDFDMIDGNGRIVSLKNYKGKTIFIDLWATWCLPCLDEFPFLDTLKQYYKDNSNLVFISLSIDNNNTAWKKYLNVHGKMYGTEYIIDRLKLAAYSVNEIPRTIIITKDYKIAMLNGPLPSSKETKNIIDALLQKE
jgi:thiol-disulfide isomerase/thioredoxin